MKTRVIKKKGKYYPQYRKLFLWKNFKYTEQTRGDIHQYITTRDVCFDGKDEAVKYAKNMRQYIAWEKDDIDEEIATIDKLVESANYENYDDVVDELTSIRVSDNMSQTDLAVAYIAHSVARDVTYEHTDNAFDIECDMRDIAHEMANKILKGENYGEKDLLREELGFL